MTNSGEYFEYRLPSKFIGEVQIAVAMAVLIGAIITLASYANKLAPQAHERDVVVGHITFSVVIVLVAVMDIAFGLILISATKGNNLGRCLMWRGSSFATLTLFGLITMGFMVILKSPIIFLGFLPTLIFKPFAMWVVKGFIDELRQLENFPHNTNTTLPPARPTFSLLNPGQIKRSTTVFRRESLLPYVIGSKIRTIAEEED